MASIISAGTTSGTALNMAGDTSGVLQLATNGSTTAITVDTSQRVGIGTASPGYLLNVSANGGGGDSAQFVRITDTNTSNSIGPLHLTIGAANHFASNPGPVLCGTNGIAFGVGDGSDLATQRKMTIDSSGNVLVGKTAASGAVAGVQLEPSGLTTLVRSGGVVLQINRLTNDGNLIDFYQDTALEGNISVSGTTVSYNGGHLSRWSQWQNETGKPNVYRGSVLESTNDMCEWKKDGEPLPNEQATKTIISTTLASKAVAGVFDRYDEDDKDNPYDFYVAQSGDFVIRIAQGVTVQNGDLLESAGDGTARPQTDDNCRSSTIAKVTSNYVSATYEDGSYCVPCILMIG